MNTPTHCIVASLVFLVTCHSQAAEPSLFQEAEAAFAAKNYAAAIPFYQQARNDLQNQKVDWLKATKQLVRSHNALGQSDQAIAEYLSYCLAAPDSPPLDCLPLPWFVPTDATSPSANPLARSETIARELLGPNSRSVPGAAGTFLAATVLTTSRDPQLRTRGQQILNELAASRNAPSTVTEQNAAAKTNEVTPAPPPVQCRQQIALLATAFLWKQTLPTLRDSSALSRMERVLNQIDEENRAGPLFLFGNAAAQVGEHESAVLAWMRLPILYPEYNILSEQSLLNAAKSLEQLGRADQARPLRTEAARLSSVRDEKNNAVPFFQ